MAQSKKKPASGAGRKSNVEPRIQDFKQFGGCNFELSPRGWDEWSEEYEQSDLQQNYLVLQNNCSIASNSTIETRNNITLLKSAPTGKYFNGVSLLVGNMLFAATTDGGLYKGSLSDSNWTQITVKDLDHPSVTPTSQITELVYGDDKLIALTEDKQVYTGDIDNITQIENAKVIIDPPAFTSANLVPRGTLQIDTSQTASCPYRIGLAYTYVNKFGPTAVSDQYVIYANTPVSEWHGGCYLQFTGTAPTSYNILAMEVYYVVDNASELQFATRYDFSTQDGGAYTFGWVGYLSDVSSWPMANLQAPTTNYTKGAPASHCAMIDGRFYFWGGERPDRLFIGGNPGNLLSISTGTGGGFVDVEPGSGLRIRVVTKYKTQSGNSIVTMLCDSSNSTREQRFNLVENSIALSNEQSMKSWQAEQVAGAVGCKSYHGGLVCEDGIYAVSRYGLALTTLTMDYNSQIRTNYVSDPVKPAFTNTIGTALSSAHLLNVDGVLYCAFGTGREIVDEVLFCYDIDKKAWYTYTIDVDEQICNLMHIDSDNAREGIGIITPTKIYLLPTTEDDAPDDETTFPFLLESGQIGTVQPLQAWHHVTQLEFNFDYFIGDATIEITAIDQFGRKITTTKEISYDEVQYHLTEYVRIDLKVESYKIRMTGTAKFRLVHFMTKLYAMSNRQGIVYGFDSRQSYRSEKDIHPTFKCYNDIRDAIFV